MSEITVIEQIFRDLNDPYYDIQQIIICGDGLIALTRKETDNTLRNEYDNFKIVQQGNQILGHLFQLKRKAAKEKFLRKLYSDQLGFLPQAYIILTKIRRRKEKKYTRKRKIRKTVFTKEKKVRKLDGTIGESGDRSRCLPHAERALYHLS